eukprot:3730609-Rhodomonas_salina.4
MSGTDVAYDGAVEEARRRAAMQRGVMAEMGQRVRRYQGGRGSDAHRIMAMHQEGRAGNGGVGAGSYGGVLEGFGAANANALVSAAVCLRACYAMPGTDVAYGGAQVAQALRQHESSERGRTDLNMLRARCAMSGTDMGHVSVVTWGMCPVLTWVMPLTGRGEGALTARRHVGPYAFRY